MGTSPSHCVVPVAARVAVAAIVTLTGSIGCGSSAPPGQGARMSGARGGPGARGSSYCEPTSASADGWPEDPAPAGATHGARIRAVLGLDALTGPIADDSTRRLATLERVEEARLAIARTSAELDCEAERAEQVGNFLQERSQSWVQSFTVASLVSGAATGIASAILMSANASRGSQLAVGVSGAGVSGTLGIGALAVHPRLEFTHPRNLLADVWSGPKTSALYPPVVWAYLSRPEFSNRGDQAIRAKIAARWKSFASLDAEQVKLLFGPGGTYDEETLHVRAAMLNQVKAEVELLNQELGDVGKTAR